MSCTNCDKTIPLCQEEKCTGCPVKNLTANCVEVNLEEFPCSGIPVPNTLDQVLLAMDEFICNKVDSVSNFIKLTNVGGGSEIYAGDDNLGRKKLRTLTSNDSSVNISQTTDTIDLSVEVTSSVNLGSIGTGDNIYRGETGGTHQFSSIKDISTTGFTPLYNGYNNGDHEFPGISSSTIEIIKDTDGNIIMNTPPQFISGVPKYIVNNGYTGTVEDGSEVRPFKTVEGAVAKFVGSGDRNNPENQNAIIEIQQGVTPYSYKEDFTYRNLNIVIKAGAIVNHEPTDFRKIMDLDTLDDTAIIVNTVYIEGKGMLNLKGDGFCNSGGVSTELRKTITLSGESTEAIRMQTAYDATRAVFKMNPENSSVPQQGSHAEIYVSNLDIRSEANPMVKIGGTSNLLVYNSQLRTFNTQTNSFKPYQQYGGAIIVENTLIVTDGVKANTVFYFNTDTANASSTFDMTRCIIQTLTGATNIFVDDSSLGATYAPFMSVRYSSTRYGTYDYIFQKVVKEQWDTITFIYNTFHEKSIQMQELVDLTRGGTISVHNFIGGALVESLAKHVTRVAAKAVLPSGSKFINTNGGSTDSTTWFIDIVI